MQYTDFLESKRQLGGRYGFTPTFLPSWLFDFQSAIVSWAIEKGRGGVFADCGLGKTPMSLAWGQNVIEHTNKPVLIIAPLAVTAQTSREADKFGIDAIVSKDGNYAGKRIVITNYERLKHFKPDDFGGVICDESSAIKNFAGQHRAEVTEFMRLIPYRSLWTATAAPNDYIELGTSSEALGELGMMDMLGRFFRNNQNNCDTKRSRAFGGKDKGWRFKGHAETAFWRWVASWARALRRPSDIGFDDSRFVLPPLIENEHVVETKTCATDMLFALPAMNWREEREERKRTIRDRCEKAASLIAGKREPSVAWCHLNEEGDLLAKMIPNSVQVSGSNTDDEKEEAYTAFARGDIENLVIKPKIGAWGMNWQHCAHVVTFASHSYEQYYQAVRRCWRFGQERPVVVDMVVSEGEVGVKNNIRRKAENADKMFTALVAEMNNATRINPNVEYTGKEEFPSWL